MRGGKIESVGCTADQALAETATYPAIGPQTRAEARRGHDSSLLRVHRAHRDVWRFDHGDQLGWRGEDGGAPVPNGK